MRLNHITEMFNEAASRMWNVKKNMLLYGSLVLSGVFFLFFQLLSFYTPIWMKWPLFCIPFFIAAAILMGIGSLFGRFYYKEKQQEAIDVKKTLFHDGETAIKASYFGMLLLLLFILLWIGLAVFLLLKLLPFFGTFFGVILAFAPFVIHFLTIMMGITAVLFSFFVLPKMGLEREDSLAKITARFRNNVFISLILLLISVVPIWFAWKLATWSALMTLNIFAFENAPVLTILQEFFILLPFMAVLTLPVHFFFNFSVEAFLWSESQNMDNKAQLGDV